MFHATQTRHAAPVHLATPAAHPLTQTPRARQAQLVSLISLAALACALLASQAQAVVLYAEDFQGTVGTEWSHTTTEATPTPYPFGERRFLGQFGNDSVTLSLGAVDAGQLRLEFDFYAIRSWDGGSIDTGFDYGSDYFRVAVAGGAVLLNETFSNGNPAGQSYGADALNPYHAGAAETYSLGYYFYDGIQLNSQVQDAVYRLGIDLLHTGGELGFTFAGYGLQTLADESWGLDNVLLSDLRKPEAAAVPEPATLPLLALGFLGLAWQARRARQNAR